MEAARSGEDPYNLDKSDSRDDEEDPLGDDSSDYSSDGALADEGFEGVGDIAKE